MKLAPKLNRREKLLLWALFAVLVLTAGYAGIYEPFLDQVRALDAEIQRLALQISEARGPYRNLAEIEAQIAAADEEIAALQGTLPEQADLGSLLRTIYDAELRSRVRVTSFDPGPVTSAKECQKLSIECSVAAPSFRALQVFLAQVEADQRCRPAISKLTAKAVPSARPEARVEASFTIVLHTAATQQGAGGR